MELPGSCGPPNADVDERICQAWSDLSHWAPHSRVLRHWPASLGLQGPGAPPDPRATLWTPARSHPSEPTRAPEETQTRKHPLTS